MTVAMDPEVAAELVVVGLDPRGLLHGQACVGVLQAVHALVPDAEAGRVEQEP